jgi:hypothetical protein
MIVLIIKILVFEAAFQSLAQIGLDARRKNTYPFIETVRPALKGALLIILRTSFLVNTETNVGK